MNLSLKLGEVLLAFVLKPVILTIVKRLSINKFQLAAPIFFLWRSQGGISQTRHSTDLLDDFYAFYMTNQSLHHFFPMLPRLIPFFLLLCVLQAHTGCLQCCSVSAQEHSAERHRGWSEPRKRNPSLAWSHEAISRDPPPSSRPTKRQLWAVQTCFERKQEHGGTEDRLKSFTPRFERKDAVLASELSAQVLPCSAHNDAAQQNQREQPVQAHLLHPVPVSHREEEESDGGRLPQGHCAADGVRIYFLQPSSILFFGTWRLSHRFAQSRCLMCLRVIIMKPA